MVKDNLTGRAVINIMVDMPKIKDMVTEKCSGPMEPFTRENGSLVLNMEKDNLSCQMDFKKRVILRIMSMWATKR